MSNKHKPCLILNIDYSPLNIISWQKAMVWSARCSDSDTFPLRIIDYHKDDSIIGGNFKPYRLPAVMQTKRYFRGVKQK